MENFGKISYTNGQLRQKSIYIDYWKIFYVHYRHAYSDGIQRVLCLAKQSRCVYSSAVYSSEKKTECSPGNIYISVKNAQLSIRTIKKILKIPFSRYSMFTVFEGENSKFRKQYLHHWKVEEKIHRIHLLKYVLHRFQQRQHVL